MNRRAKGTTSLKLTGGASTFMLCLDQE